MNKHYVSNYRIYEKPYQAKTVYKSNSHLLEGSEIDHKNVSESEGSDSEVRDRNERFYYEQKAIGSYIRDM